MIAVPAVKRRRLTPPPSSEEEFLPSTLVERANAAQDDFFTRASKWNLEQDYEQKPRKQKKKDKENTRLPIKTAEGKIEQLSLPEVKEDDQDSFLESGEEADQVVQQPSPVEEKAPKIPARQQINEAKEELARLASLISEDPEENAGAFKLLGQIATSSNPTIKRLGLVAQLAVFKDVIPGYRIRPIGDLDSTEKISKEVRRLRSFEQALVGSYQAYVKELAKRAKVGKDSSEASETTAQVAISCACALLLAVPHFNFRGEILKILVDKLSYNKVDANFIKCRETLETLFRDDEDGTPSLDAVTLLTKMIKARDYRVNESVLNTFLHLRLLSEFSSKASQDRIDKPSAEDRAAGKKPKPKREFRTKKQRKVLKEQKAVEKEFKEADAIVSHEERDRMQAETLKLVFVTYFRILKARSPRLMGAVLEGLAKYAHLINQDFFGDILEALKDLINDAEALSTTDPDDPETPKSTTSTRSTLLCIATAFALLAGQDVAKSASSLSLDLSFFTAHLYKSLYSLSLNPDLEFSSKSLHLPDPHSSPTTNQQALPAQSPTKKNKVNLRTTASLLHTSLSSILTPRTTPPVRIAAFVKQLHTVLLQTPEKSSIALLSLLQQVLKVHGRKVAGLWNTEERRGDGVFDALKGEVEGSNPFASTVWEGELLRLHYARGVRDGVRGVDGILKGLV
ncbi:nucleolar complex-associated protein 3 [Physcia stellaris]|nr:nucleolar complex-associated protein 3 [Physcia stellaris]